MRKDPEKILHILKKVTLPADEKSAMRFMLLSRIETQERIRKMNTRQESPFSFPNFIFGKHMVAGMVVILLVASTGVTLAAEDTLPGDLLYGVKIHVTEEVRGALTVGSTAKVMWEKDRVVKRVVETETLIKEKKLTPARKVRAQTAIKEQIKKFDTMATSEKENPVGVIEATSDLEPTLKAHQEVLANLGIDTPSAETDDIIQTVEVGIQISGAQESTALDSIDTLTPEKLNIAVDNKITDTENAIEILSKTDIDSDAAEKQNQEDLESAGEVGTDNDSIESPETTGVATTTDTSTPLVTPQTTTEATTEVNIPILEPKITTDETIGVETPSVAPITSTSETMILSTTPEAALPAPSTATVTDTATPIKTITDAKIKSDNRKEVLLRAKATLVLAREKKAKGELAEALRLAQQAYKSVLELNVGTQLSQDAAKKETKNDTPLDQPKVTEESTEKKEIVSTTPSETTPTNTPVANTPGVVDPAMLQAQTILPIQ